MPKFRFRKFLNKVNSVINAVSRYPNNKKVRNQIKQCQSLDKFTRATDAIVKFEANFDMYLRERSASSYANNPKRRITIAMR